MKSTNQKIADAAMRQCAKQIKPKANKIKTRLEYLRGEIQAERISTGEILELQSLAAYIAPDDVLLREWAGLPE
jgi:hypothetical protein